MRWIGWHNSMPRINCHLPIKLCITGRLDDAQLEQLSETLVRAVSARISFAEQEITARHSSGVSWGEIEVRGPYDEARADAGDNSYTVPSYNGGGRPVSMRLGPSRNLDRRPWFIRRAVYLHSSIGNFLDFLEFLEPSETSPRTLYMDMFEELRWVFAWLVQVNQEYQWEELETVLSERANALARVHQEDQILVWGMATNEQARQKLIRIDKDGVVAREIPTLANHNARLVGNIGGDLTVFPGAWILFTGMVLPIVEGDDLIELADEETVELPLHALDFIVNPASFERLFNVSWDSHVNQFGDQPVLLRILPFTTLRRVHFQTLKYLIEPSIIESVERDSASFGNVYLLNQTRLAWLPSAARAKARQLSNEVTLPLDESQREGWWEAGWRGAYVYAVVNATGEQPVQPAAERASQQDPSETPEQLISRFTSRANLDEDGLGAYLAGLTRRSPALSHYVQRVLDELEDRNRDDVSLAFVESAESYLDTLAQSPNGRLLLGRLYNELTSGELDSSEKNRAQQVLEARLRARSIEVVARRLETARGWIFPHKQGGPTVLHDSPLQAELLPDGRIRVWLMNRVATDDTFRDEVRTLPRGVFSGGIILEPDDWVRVKLYDEGGTIVPVPALYLLQISNQGITKTLHTIGTVIITVGTFGLGTIPAGATWGVRTLVWLDRAATGLSILGIVVDDHRGWIIQTFGDKGRDFINAIEVANAVAGIYGIGRLAISAPRIIGNVRNAWRDWRASRAYGGLRGADLSRAEHLSQQAEQFIHNADEAAAVAQSEAAAVPAVDPAPVEPPSTASQSRTPQGTTELPPEPPGGGPPGSGPTLLQRQRAAALRSDATALEQEAASLIRDAEVLEQRATAAASTRPDRAARLRQRAARMRRVSTHLQDEINAARTEANEFESGARSATAEFPETHEVDLLFQSAQSDTHVIQIPLAQIERRPGLLLRLIRPIMRSRSGGRVVFRVEGGGSRELIQINAATGNVRLSRGDTIHLNFGSEERALEFLQANRSQGARMVAFEVDEAWAQSFRSGAIPEHGTGAIRGTQRSVDVMAAEDQLQVPGNLLDELERFIIPGSGREIQVTVP
jgi:hypothetical protein